MEDDRLPSHVWIMAQIRRCNADGIPAMVVQKGEVQTGTLLLKINQFETGCRVLSQMRDLDGAFGWMAAFDGAAVPEAMYVSSIWERRGDAWLNTFSQDSNAADPAPV